MRQILRSFVLLIFTGLVAAQNTPGQSSYNGFWVTPNFSSIVEVSDCTNSLCAEIAWLWQVSIAGRQLFDKKNPDSAKHRQTLIGLQLFKQFKPDGNNWRGRIYNPEDGRSYRASIRQINPDVLFVRGCWGPFCRSQRWRRLSSVSMPSEAELKLRK